jgi:hypothetical protein
MAVDNDGDLHVTDLTDMMFHGVKLAYGEEIECPYCRTIHCIANLQEWKSVLLLVIKIPTTLTVYRNRRHVYLDLQPYIRTYEECSTEM